MRDEPVVLALGMVSDGRPSKFAVRELVRSTMLLRRPPEVAFRFVVGMPRGQTHAGRTSARATLRKLRMEADVVVLPGASDVADGFKLKQCACIEKLLGWYAYAMQRWPRAAFYGKTEDDSYLNLPMLLFDLQRPEVAAHRLLLLGMISVCTTPPLDWALAHRSGLRACFFGDLMPADMVRNFNKWREHTNECRAGAPSPFATGALGVFSRGFARLLFQRCPYLQRFLRATVGTAAGASVNASVDVAPDGAGAGGYSSCARGAAGANHSSAVRTASLKTATCDCVVAGWTEACLRDAGSALVVATLTWTKVHNYATAAGAHAWVAPSNTSVVVHDLKGPVRKRWEDAHRASSAASSTPFPPLLWSYEPPRPAAEGRAHGRADAAAAASLRSGAVLGLRRGSASRRSRSSTRACTDGTSARALRATTTARSDARSTPSRAPRGWRWRAECTASALRRSGVLPRKACRPTTAAIPRTGPSLGAILGDLAPTQSTARARAASATSAFAPQPIQWRAKVSSRPSCLVLHLARTLYRASQV